MGRILSYIISNMRSYACGNASIGHGMEKDFLPVFQRETFASEAEISTTPLRPTVFRKCIPPMGTDYGARTDPALPVVMCYDALTDPSMTPR